MDAEVVRERPQVAQLRLGVAEDRLVVADLEDLDVERVRAAQHLLERQRLGGPLRVLPEERVRAEPDHRRPSTAAARSDRAAARAAASSSTAARAAGSCAKRPRNNPSTS